MVQAVCHTPAGEMAPCYGVPLVLLPALIGDAVDEAAALGAPRRGGEGEAASAGERPDAAAVGRGGRLPVAPRERGGGAVQVALQRRRVSLGRVEYVPEPAFSEARP